LFIFGKEFAKHSRILKTYSMKTIFFSSFFFLAFAFNAQESDLKQTTGLYPCAYEVLFSVREINDIMFLDMTLNQRSSDYIVANFINKTQYLALQMMIAAHLGYKVGKFCHFVQNLHIYDRHLESAKEILFRSPLEQQPKISLHDKKDFYQVSIKDFTIENVESIKKLSEDLEIAI
jgi:thymidylate synthase